MLALAAVRSLAFVVPRVSSVPRAAAFRTSVVTMGRKPGVMEPADLAAFDCDGRIVGHVLGFKRRHRMPALDQGPAEPGGQQGLAHVGARPLEHDGFGGHWNACP